MRSLLSEFCPTSFDKRKSIGAPKNIRADTNDTHNLVNDTNNLWMRKDFSTVILGMIVDIVDVNSDCIPSNRKNILAFCNPL
ncbi:unnamed protein product [Rhizophagus irregularis]|nr:unnamed protein product [Rhizophagus irregularis]